MLNIALTGGIASGKTTVSNIFAEHGANIIDTDLISREIVQAGKPALQQIAQTFGQQVIQNNGQLDRGRLRQIIFSNLNARKQLENILHPLIREQAWQQAKNNKTGYNLLVIPLLYENQAHYGVDRVLVVDIPLETQKNRLKQRDQLSDNQVEQILSSQSSREQRLGIADDIIENTGLPEDLYAQVKKLHQQYIKL